MKPFAIFLTLWLAFPAQGQVKPPDVILPVLPVPIIPVPNPITPTLIAPNQFYVIQSSAPVIVLTSPDGVVKVSNETGPLRMRGFFVDGTGAMETRTFKGPNIYIVEAAGQGTCELIIVSAMNPATVIRRTLTTGTAPPPGPADPVTQAMSDAIKADGQPASVAATLAKVYRTAGTAILSTTDRPFGQITTYGELFAALKPIQDAAVPPATITHLRTVVGQQFATGLGSTQADPINRPLASRTFNAIATQLEGVK